MLCAKEKGLISAIKPYTMVIQQTNFYLSDWVVSGILRLER
ncbi:DUF3368 domain-containing protein [Thiothrix fructosivorans]|uniref:DUF3368 domain-containing protein n=1 Tax=Thiothrix fructosivorans TaxID=111770 RepID=A0A8B0SQ50_9GAMM|nr:DUF3368 domain-containing protein [Thiothrix fructosivorans]QTX11817.1 DUF3368 domain-containing protein [Thiothrix fructosivorans]